MGIVDKVDEALRAGKASFTVYSDDPDVLEAHPIATELGPQ